MQKELQNNIVILPQSVANRIAAGEIIERPSSMLKELLENAIDSNATKIEVTIEEAGIKTMSVEDNGNGIKFEDLPLAVMHHATSKIHSIEDLEAIYTLGFRGEALASIADVTHLEIVSKNKDENSGGHIVIEGGKLKEHKPHPAVTGTKVTAKNLFYNIPARYKFLKHPSREFFLIKEVFDTEALTNPKISMKLKNNGKHVNYYKETENLKERIFDYVNDKNIEKNLIEIKAEKEDISIYGLISNMKISESMRKNNFIFLNNRPIENRALSYAIRSAYSGIIPKERYPYYFIYIEIDRDKVDVNVHPSKKEVRIKNEKDIAGMLYGVINKNVNNGFSSVDMEKDIDEEYTSVFTSYKIKEEESGSSGINYTSDLNKNYNNNSVVDYKNNDKIEYEKVNQNTFGEYLRAVGQVFSSYIVAERGTEMYIIDQHAAYERLNYERVYKTITKGKLEYEKLLIPCDIEYRDYEIAVLESAKEKLESIGIKFEINSKTSIIIEEVPLYMPKNQKIDNIIKDILDIYVSKGDNDSLDKLIKHTAATISCKYSPKAGDRLGLNDMQKLLDLLEKENILSSCPHGRPFILKLSKDYLDRKFFRIL